MKHSYYDNAGNITFITDSLNSTRNRIYSYDALNRLTSATSTSYGGTLTWQYIKTGNMMYNCRYGNYEYDSSHPHAVKKVYKNGAVLDEYTYDANGNMTSGAGRTINYDYDNRATSIAKGGSANSVYVEPVRPDCFIHWEVNPEGIIIGSKLEGTRCW